MDRAALTAIRTHAREVADAADTALDIWSNEQLRAQQISDVRAGFAALSNTIQAALVRLATAQIPGGTSMSTDTTASQKAVIVRTFSAGVHFGYLVARDGKEVTLERSRRLWRWYGANTLSDIAAEGLDTRQSKTGAPVSIVLTEAIEIIDCTPKAVESLEAAKWAA